jgi:phage tail-like protein
MAVTFGRDKLKGTAKTMGDFNLGNRFSVEIDGVSVAGVHTIEGIETETDVVEYKDGEDRVNRTRPGNHKPGKVIMHKDWSNTLEWYTWRKKVLDGVTDRRSISVIFLADDNTTEVGRMNFYNTWPTKHVLPTFKATSSAHASEQIHISFETMDIKV